MSKQAAFNTLNKFATARVQLVQGMIDAGYPTAEDARNVVIEWACAKTGAEFRWNKDETKAMLVSSHPKYEAAKTTVRDVMLNLQGTTRRQASSAKAEPTKTRVSAEERAAFEAFLAACGDAGRALTVFKALTK
jgi:hypothetical protein